MGDSKPEGSCGNLDLNFMGSGELLGGEFDDVGIFAKQMISGSTGLEMGRPSPRKQGVCRWEHGLEIWKGNTFSRVGW